MKRRNGRGAKAGRETDARRAWKSKNIHIIVAGTSRQVEETRTAWSGETVCTVRTHVGGTGDGVNDGKSKDLMPEFRPRVILKTRSRVRNANLGRETDNRRAGCGKSASPVRREGWRTRAIPTPIFPFLDTLYVDTIQKDTIKKGRPARKVTCFMEFSSFILKICKASLKSSNKGYI